MTTGCQSMDQFILERPELLTVDLLRNFEFQKNRPRKRYRSIWVACWNSHGSYRLGRKRSIGLRKFF